MLSAVILAASLGACSREYVPPGNVGILVDLRGQDKGVQQQVLGAGRYTVGLNEKLYIFPTVSQNYVYSANGAEGSKENEEMTFQDKDGMSIKGDFGVTYNILAEKVPSIFQRYSKGVEDITNVVIRNALRDALIRHASKLGIETIYGSGKGPFMDEVQKDLRSEMQPIGINIDKVYAVSELRLPRQIIDAINSKLEQNQTNAKAAAEIAGANAHAQRRMIEAKAEADANLTIAKSITPEYLQYLWIQKWDAHLPQFLSGSGVQPLVSLAVPQVSK